MQPQQTQERKPPPPVEVSMNYLSWSVKDLVKVLTATQEIQARTLSKIGDSLDKILVAISKDTPF
jgi:hypothetical protein